MAPRRKTGSSSRWATWSNKVSSFDVAALFQRAPPPKTARTVFVQEDLPLDYYNVKKNGKKTIKRSYVYPTNQVVTSKYTVFTFLPRNLLEQFRRVANMQVSSTFSWSLGCYIDILTLFWVSAASSWPSTSSSSSRNSRPSPPVSSSYPSSPSSPSQQPKTAMKTSSATSPTPRSTTQKHRSSPAEASRTPNIMGQKAKTFTPGIPKALVPRRKRKHAVEEGEDEKENGGSTAAIVDADPPPAIRVQHISSPSTSGSPTPGEPASPLADEENVDDDSGEPTWRTTLWEDVRVGDFIRLRANEPVPADIVICATSEPENVAFIETKNLDGETNLKSRHAVPELVHLTSAREIVESTRRDASRFHIDAEAPDVNMFKLNAAVVTGQGEDAQTDPIDVQTMILRGTILRNTDWVIGIVLYTGADTKIVLNSGATPSKRSRVERQMNPMV